MEVGPRERRRLDLRSRRAVAPPPARMARKQSWLAQCEWGKGGRGGGRWRAVEGGRGRWREVAEAQHSVAEAT